MRIVGTCYRWGCKQREMMKHGDTAGNSGSAARPAMERACPNPVRLLSFFPENWEERGGDEFRFLDSSPKEQHLIQLPKNIKKQLGDFSPNGMFDCAMVNTWLSFAFSGSRVIHRRQIPLDAEVQTLAASSSERLPSGTLT